MPKFLEQKLRAEYGNNAHTIYGTMNKIGAMHGSKITAKGREMERKHEADMKTPKERNIREIRIEVHRSKGKITGHTVHHHMMPKPTTKSHAFMEHETSSFPFAADDHNGMMDHVHKALAGTAGTGAGAAAGASESKEEEPDEDEA